MDIIIYLNLKEKGGNEEGYCSICKQEKPKNQLKNEENKCSLCKNFEKITQELVGIKYIIKIKLKDEIDGNNPINSINDISSVFNYNIKLIKNNDELRNYFNQINTTSIERLDIEILNNTNLSDLSNLTSLSDLNPVEVNIGFSFMSTIVPKENGLIKDFDNIVINKNSKGDSKLGLLRMDIDNLGIIFSEGLKINSLSRLSSLSFRLKIFFKYWINELCKGNIIPDDLADSIILNKINDIRSNNKDFLTEFITSIKNNVYLIYSSGDDLFLIGHWNDIINLSLIIRESFTKYVMKNPNLTISGGISVLNPKFPLYQGAALTGNAEEVAKSQKDKNSLCIFSETYYWEDFKNLCLIKEKIYDYCKFKGLGKNFIHKLLTFNQNYKKVYSDSLISLKSTDMALIQNKNKMNLYYNVENDPVKTANEAAYYSSWYWQFVYYFKRTMDSNKSLKGQLEELKSQIVEERMIKDLFVPLRWAELLIKKKSSL